MTYWSCKKKKKERKKERKKEKKRRGEKMAWWQHCQQPAMEAIEGRYGKRKRKKNKEEDKK